jgi:hypothetical protein
MTMGKRLWAERARARRREERPKVSIMRFKSGNHEGETTEEVLLKHPDFAQWTIQRYPESPHGRAFIRLTQEFDDKPFTEDCREECGRKATRATACRDSSGLYFWCDECDPFSTGARQVAVIYTLSELLRHVDSNADGNRALKRRIVRRLAEAKGLPKRVGEEAALDFFSQGPHDLATGLSTMVKRPACRWKPPRFPTFRR